MEKEYAMYLILEEKDLNLDLDISVLENENSKLKIKQKAESLLFTIQKELCKIHHVYCINDSSLNHDNIILNVISFINNEFIDKICDLYPDEYIFDENCFICHEDDNKEYIIGIIQGCDCLDDVESVIDTMNWCLSESFLKDLCSKEDYELLKKIKVYYIYNFISNI